MNADRDVRAVVADDSRFMRTVITDMLSNAGIDIVAEASNGREAVEAVAQTRPDVVTMDIEMPEVNGIEAVERIMNRTPTPILMLSAHAAEDADVTFEAMDKGAVDFFTKPGGEVSTGMPAHEDRLVEKLVSVARSDVSAPTTRSPTPASPTAGGGASTAGAGASSTRNYRDDATLVVGASTGGPGAVERVLSALPAAADLRVLVVQHMPDEFTARFAKRLDERSAYDVREASDGDHVDGGDALVAPGGKHMEVARERRGRLRVELTEDPPEHGVRPAIDVTMRTAAEVVDGPLVAVVLTGMGKDGAEGVRAITDAGGVALAQDEDTSAIYGMPRAAVATGRIDRELPIDDVAGGVADAVSGGDHG